MQLDKDQQVFFELLRAGLWEKELRLSKFEDIDYSAIMRLAEEQSVVGLVTAGLEHVSEVKVPQEVLLQFIGSTLQIEQQNKNLNVFLAWLIEKLRKADVYAVLVKGQGVAQCYEKPLWRSSGDIDLLLSVDNYEKAKLVLLPLAIETETEFKSLKHLGMTMEGGFVVELHGMFHSRLSKRVDKVIDDAQNDVFFAGNVRSEEFKSSSGATVQVFLPSPDNDVIFIFTHILKHFYIEGVGLRQICDWCRSLWICRNQIDNALLQKRLSKAGLMTEWKAFAAFAVDCLGMPVEAIPFYSPDKKWSRKAKRILLFVMETGNFGHNRQIPQSDNCIIGKMRAVWFKMHDFARHARLFPLDSVCFFFHYAMNGVSTAQDRLNDKKA